MANWQLLCWLLLLIQHLIKAVPLPLSKLNSHLAPFENGKLKQKSGSKWNCRLPGHFRGYAGNAGWQCFAPAEIDKDGISLEPKRMCLCVLSEFLFSSNFRVCPAHFPLPPSNWAWRNLQSALATALFLQEQSTGHHQLRTMQSVICL